jgi:RNA polymerase sigma-70 factor, ECF subfamily
MALLRTDRNTVEPTDAQLAAYAARGQADALAALYARYAKDLLATAWRLLQSRADAEDVVHDVFVGLPEALRRYEERGALGAWLRTITARLALMRLREQTALPLAEVNNQDHAAAPGKTDASLTVEQVLRRLSPNLRAVLVLKEIEGFTHAEIAALLDISIGASEVRLHRALKALREMLLKDDTR